MALGALTHQVLGELKCLGFAKLAKGLEVESSQIQGIGVKISLLSKLSTAVHELQALNLDEEGNPLVETGIEVYTDTGKRIELKIGDFVESPHYRTINRFDTACGYVARRGEKDHVIIRFCVSGTGNYVPGKIHGDKELSIHKDSILLVNDEIRSAQTEFGNGARDVDAIAKAMIADVAIATQARDLAEQERAAAELQARKQRVETRIITRNTDTVAVNTTWRDILSGLVVAALCMGLIMGGLYQLCC